MSDVWRGRYADGQTAVVHEVVVHVEDGALVGRSDDGGDAELFRWPLSALAREDLEPGRVRITCVGVADASLTTDAAFALGLDVMPERGGRRARRGRLALAFGLGIVVLAGGIYLGLTPLARLIAFHVPAAAEASLGQGLAAILATQYCETKDARAVAEGLAGRLGAPPGTKLHILDVDTVNAFTFPGGVVILTRGLLEQAEDPDEVAGILAHELEHVRQRHVMIRFVRTSMMTALWQATVGDYSGLFVIDPKTALDIANLRFSRNDEREADRGALERLDGAHISHDGFRSFFDRMRAKTDFVPAWLSSHPASAERIESMRPAFVPPSVKAALGARRPSAPALGPSDWKALKSGCAKK